MRLPNTTAIVDAALAGTIANAKVGVKSLYVWGTQIKVPSAAKLRAAALEFADKQCFDDNGVRFAKPVSVKLENVSHPYVAGFTAKDQHVFGAGVVDVLGTAVFERPNGKRFQNSIVVFIRFGGTDGNTQRLEAVHFRAPPTRASSLTDYQVKIANRLAKTPYPPELFESHGTGTFGAPVYSVAEGNNGVVGFKSVVGPWGFWGLGGGK